MSSRSLSPFDPSFVDPVRAEAAALSEALKEKHGLERFDVWAHTPRRAAVTLHLVRVARERRGSGRAEAALRELCSWADARGFEIYLSPSTEFGASKTRLERWYLRHGFVRNKGRNKDFTVSESMIRRSRVPT